MNRPVRRDTWSIKGGESEAAIYISNVASVFSVELHERAGVFHNSLDTFHLGEVIFGRFSGVGQVFRRTREHFRQDGLDHLQIVHSLKGAWRGDYDGRLVRGGEGVMRFVDMSRPLSTDTEAFETLNLMIPRALLGAQGARDMHGLVPPPSSPMVRLLVAQLHAIAEAAEELTITDGAPLCRTLTEMVRAIIEVHAPSHAREQTEFDLNVLARARAFVDAAPASGDLTPKGVQALLGVSRSVLYRIFEGEGGVAAFIQGRRLDRAFLALTNADDRRNIAVIAEAHGFQSDAHFSRSFKARFSIRPGELRGLRGKVTAIPTLAADNPAATLVWLRGI